jgi:hypothetical protein
MKWENFMSSQRLITFLLALLIWSAIFSMPTHAQVTPNTSNAESSQSTETVNEPDNITQTWLEKTAPILKWFFTVWVYPVLVCCIFALLLISIIVIILKGSGSGYVPRITGAILPFILLTFMLLLTERGNDPIKNWLVHIGNPYYLLVGIVIGIIAMEVSRYFLRPDNDRGGAIYNLFLSLTVVFILYAIMKEFTDRLAYFLFGMIMAGGLDIIFRQSSTSKVKVTQRIPKIEVDEDSS